MSTRYEIPVATRGTASDHPLRNTRWVLRRVVTDGVVADLPSEIGVWLTIAGPRGQEIAVVVAGLDTCDARVDLTQRAIRLVDPRLHLADLGDCESLLERRVLRVLSGILAFQLSGAGLALRTETHELHFVRDQ